MILFKDKKIAEKVRYMLAGMGLFLAAILLVYFSTSAWVDRQEQRLQNMKTVQARTFQAHANFLRIWRMQASGESTRSKALSGLLQQQEALLQDLSESAPGTLRQRFKAVAEISLSNSTEIETELTEIEQQLVAALESAEAEKKRAELGIDVSYIILLLLAGGILSRNIWHFGRDTSSTLNYFIETMEKVNRGDLQTRTGLKRNDEFGQVGRAFDRLLDERIAELEKIELQNNELNESIISMIQRVGTIANQKDFTVKVPVAEDITGAVADSVNLLVSEVSKVLSEVVQVSNYLEQASQVIVHDAEKVADDSASAREQVEGAVQDLEGSVSQMAEVSEQSNLVADWADNTINHTQSAFEAVTKSVENINSIRDTISETEKRIKRLGERSQEITGIVNLINNIAERTHILALNASMHAASAGEAGRGFAVVADEVQRLAENAREATAEISTLVNNIHVETSDTVTIMNKVISQVADGTRLADQAGALMTETKVNTTELVSAVKLIAEDATSQADRAGDIKLRMQAIEEVTRLIDTRLGEQKRNSDSMASFAAQLVAAVQVFSLSEQDDR